MRISGLYTCASVTAIGLALVAAPALAQTAPPPAGSPAPADQSAAPADPAAGQDTLADIVVTASRGDRSKLNTSTSISSVDAKDIANFNATSTAELYRLIPGIQVAGTQGDGGNSNIGVRGLRTPTGGSPFVQVQEDGLPTVLFGDIQFGNNDYWTHPDPQTQRVEAIRGGTASTLASQAIGAVLNHISYTGRNDGGFVEIEKGVNYDFTKLNARIGGSINDSTYYNLGGYYDVGRGVEHAAYNVSNSYLVKGNITKDLADNRGYVRLLFKVADTREPSYNGCITAATLSGNRVSNIRPSSLCDVRNQAPGYSALNSNALFANADGSLQTQNLDGISTKQKYVQLQTHYDFGGGLTIDDNARVARMSGTFAVQFYGAGLASGAVGAGQSLIYANGPNAGKLFTGTYVSASSSVHTNMSHMDHVANDLSASYHGDLGGSVKFDLKVGYFYYSQRIAEDWHSNGSINEATGRNPAQLDLVSGPNGTGNLLAVGGQTGFNQGWNQQFDATFTDNAPYADLSLDIGNLNIDGSIREEFFHGSGWAQGSSGTAVKTAQIVQTDPRTGAQVTTSIPQLGYDGAKENINFGESTTNYSIGALYKVTPSLSVFGRYSHGVRFNADRLTRSTPSYFNADGTLSSAGLANARFPVTQYELGLKNRGDLLGGRYTVELTGFYSKYTISSQEISQTNCFNILGVNTPTCIISGNYRDKGVELFATYRNGGFNLVLSATYDDSKVSKAQGQPFLKSPNIPDLTYTGLLSYDIAKAGEVGISVNGQTSTPGGDGNIYPGSALFGAFIRVRPVEHLQLGLEAYNLFNVVALQGAAGFVGGSNNTLLNAGAAQGRAIKASVRFSF
ncbi:MAG: TonB-dependent receptor [Sphingomonas sp.]|uniref:TonB-dependent receptor n=1 Tax=Sphingomonas sp. TaxID=28214 RepID=UPI001ACAE741|nr:TonB-dependent receptor [Sphingomonas sp.]MBN8806646.1 TonB-dependent receptor [Sphingomonas sp.]